MSEIYDVAVIGAGMFGSAAAKYLAQNGARVVVIGPNEPQDRHTAATQRAFGAHYDQARITRRIGWDDVWWETDSRSLDRFRNIEDESGIPFFFEQGSLVLTAKSMSQQTNSILDKCAKITVSVERFSKQDIEDHLPYLSAPLLAQGTEGLYERKLAGYLNPRKMVQAQLTIAQKHRAHLVRQTAIGVEKNNENNIWRIHTTQGDIQSQIHAHKVLVTAGAYANHNNILPPRCKLDIDVFTEPNLMFEVNQDDIQRLRDMPAILISDPEELGNQNKSAYIVPPITYPDGKTYIRIGPGMQPIVTKISALEEMCEWYARQEITPLQYNFLFSLLTQLMPTIQPVTIRHSSCIIEKTRTLRPYIGPVNNDPSYHVAVGGNGRGARGSDEIGRLAANLLLHNKWDFPISQSIFTPLLMGGSHP